MDIISKNSVAIAGEFAVLSQLVLRGFDANMTLGHTKGVDILISDPNRNKMFKMEVKTHHGKFSSRSKTIGWLMSEKHEKIVDENLYYCFVNIDISTHIFKFYIVPSAVVAKYVKTSHKHWLSDDNHNPTSMRVFSLALSESDSVNIPLAKNYENKWDFTRISISS